MPDFRVFPALAGARGPALYPGRRHAGGAHCPTPAAAPPPRRRRRRAAPALRRRGLPKPQPARPSEDSPRPQVKYGLSDIIDLEDLKALPREFMDTFKPSNIRAQNARCSSVTTSRIFSRSASRPPHIRPHARRRPRATRSGRGRVTPTPSSRSSLTAWRRSSPWRSIAFAPPAFHARHSAGPLNSVGLERRGGRLHVRVCLQEIHRRGCNLALLWQRVLCTSGFEDRDAHVRSFRSS